ncbi:uncharacterized protein [Syngnathus scovelli]|uniref:uncharacterized protein isoform X2 n=1 Tax=Syngnathus scovelli TaxID=161590 RepID=UPI002110C8A4|nr:uncharacterized protein LOC125966972 isoform X2 [Syngnathus scovelli]
MCSRGAAQCEGGLCATKERRGQLPDAVCNETPLVVHAADVTEGELGSWQQQQQLQLQLQSRHIKQEEWPKPCHIKEEEQEDEITTFQLTDVSVKFEEDVGEEDFEQKLWSSSGMQQREAEPPNMKGEEQEEDVTAFPLTVIVKSEDDDDDPAGGRRSDSLVAPRSESDHATSCSRDTERAQRAKDFLQSETSILLMEKKKKKSTSTQSSVTNEPQPVGRMEKLSSFSLIAIKSAVRLQASIRKRPEVASLPSRAKHLPGGSQPAIQPTIQPAIQLASQPASHPASQPARKATALFFGLMSRMSTCWQGVLMVQENQY